MRKLTLDEHIAYSALSNDKEKYGVFHRSCFHVHTPESHDYKLRLGWDEETFQKSTYMDLLQMCFDENVFPKNDEIVEALEIFCSQFNLYRDKKELCAFLLLANSIIAKSISIVVVADHNTIKGIEKLRNAIKFLKELKGVDLFPEVVSGVEITCADKNHVVGIFDDSKSKAQVEAWLQENVMTEVLGSFRTAYEVLEFFNNIDEYAYLAHINSSEMFKDGYSTFAYKKKLFSSDSFKAFGLSQPDDYDRMITYLNRFNSSKKCCVWDNDSHNIDELLNNNFWIKGSKRNIQMLKDALNDFDVSITFSEPVVEKQYIKGLYIEYDQNGFLKGKNEKESFCLHFSDALNCLIGGRGSGKSSVLELLEYTLGQRCDTENKLEFLCQHGNVWILYYFKGDDYLIKCYLPSKEYVEDSILQRFGLNKENRYGYSYFFHSREIREYIIKNDLEIFKVIVSESDEIMLESISNKKELMNTLFDTIYSVNDLVHTAGSELINDFIYTTLFSNKTLSNPSDTINFRSIRGLKNAIKNIKGSLKKRNDDVMSVISPFNESQKGLLKIGYSQCKIPQMPDFNLWFQNYSKWYKNYNLSRKNIFEYLTVLFSKFNIIDLFALILEENYEQIQKKVNIFSFCSDLSPEMIDLDIVELKSTDNDAIMKSIFNDLINDNSIINIRDYLRNYVKEIEQFVLEFNINNKEGAITKEIYKPVSNLSLGQKVVAMLSFILGYSDYSKDYRPLILDQPEDNLDNQYIYKNLVYQLRQIKEKRQVIIATHNATIVTNAMADQVCVMKSDNEHGWVETVGYPGEIKIKKHILNYLEGGKESFLHKQNIYRDALK